MQIVDLLILSHADLNESKVEATARAAKARHLNRIRPLLKAGASVKMTNSDSYLQLNHTN